MSSNVRLGLIGYGGMGTSHCEWLTDGRVPGVNLLAVADNSPDHLEAARSKYGDKFQYFNGEDELLNAGLVDAVLIATPHYFHPTIAIKAFGKGLHVMSEKPAGVYTKQVLEMIDAAKASGKVFGVMFNQRTRPVHRKLRELVQSGELGEIKRTMYVITDWLRTQFYYDAATWKGTWKGEGGAVLLNQSPHNLDLFQWICGMPSKVRAFCKYGHYHNIETEDAVTAYVEYPNGATGTFITSTGECPGSHLMEIHGDRGKVVFDGERITFHRTVRGVQEFIDTDPHPFSKPDIWHINIPPGRQAGEEHIGILKNFVHAIHTGEKLLAPGEEGVHGVELADAMLMSDWLGETVDVPIDHDRFHQLLEEKIRNSTFQKATAKTSSVDFTGSF